MYASGFKKKTLLKQTYVFLLFFSPEEGLYLPDQDLMTAS